MTPHQRVLAALRRTTLPDGCPFGIGWGAFTPGLIRVDRDRTGSGLEPCERFDFDTRSVNLAPTRKQTDFRRFYPDPISNKGEAFAAAAKSAQYFPMETSDQPSTL